MDNDTRQTLTDSAAPLRRRAKIVCTIGPASDTEEMMRELMLRGMDVARLNFSHGTHDDHAQVIHRLRKVAAELGRTICILQDLQGPKIRTGRLKDRNAVTLQTGQTVSITPQDVLGTSEIISTTYQELAHDVKPGEHILLSDGRIELVVRRVAGDDVICEVLNGGMLGEHQGINLPGTNVSIPSLTAKDEEDIDFGLMHRVDLIAISFVRTADDVVRARRAISSRGGTAPLIAKLEKPQAIDNLDSILEVANGVMVARGDLGVEVAPEKVPLIQKQVIRRALDFRKPVITATQMLESMIENPRPTRAEASDVANAIFDGTDAVMLSAETASGKYPREAVAMMTRIVVETESHMAGRSQRRRRTPRRLSIAETICEAIAHAAEDLEMRAIAVFTETGTTARLISKYRPKAQVYAFSAFSQVCNRLNLFWGVRPVLSTVAPSSEQMVRNAEEYLLRARIVAPGDVIGVVAGTQMASGSTNFMRLHVVSSPVKAKTPERRRMSRLKPVPERRR